MPGWLHKSTVALQNPKQFPERLSFISLFIFVAFATAESCLEKKENSYKRDRRESWCFWGSWRYPSSSFTPCVTYFLFFTLRVTHCRVESKFLTLKISCKGTTKLLETDGGTEVDRIEGSMTQRIEKIERERESKSEWERGGKGREVAKCGANKREEKKKSQAERKDYIGDFGFRVSSGPKPISRFSVFPPARTATRIRCPLYERWNETRLILRPDFVTSHIKSRSTL